MENAFAKSVREYAEAGTLADQFEFYLGGNISEMRDENLLPKDDSECQRVVRDAMAVFFEKKDVGYEPSSEEAEGEFINFVRFDAKCGSLREQFGIFVCDQGKRLPEEDVVCRNVVERAMEVYFECQ